MKIKLTVGRMNAKGLVDPAGTVLDLSDKEAEFVVSKGAAVYEPDEAAGVAGEETAAPATPEAPDAGGEQQTAGQEAPAADGPLEPAAPAEGSTPSLEGQPAAEPAAPTQPPETSATSPVPGQPSQADIDDTLGVLEAPLNGTTEPSGDAQQPPAASINLQ